MSYSSELSRLRAAKLQQLCANRDLQCLVFILGLDSKRNKLDESAFFWLFKGVTGLSRLASSSVPLDYEELAWVVTPGSVEIYIGSACNNTKQTEAIGRAIELVSASWLGVQVYKLTTEEVQDSDLGQESKILWFTRRLSRLKGKVGMCASSEVDRWPLVQAYALDMFGLSFFTRSHKVSDISEDLLKLFAELDEAALHTMIKEQLPRLERSFHQTSEYINQSKAPEGRGLLQANDVKETLAFSFDYARIQSEDQAPQEPWVKFGPGVTELKDCSIVSLQGVCGESGMLFCRTWFVAPHNSSLSYWSDPDIRSAMNAYLEMSRALSAAIEKAAQLSEEDLKQRVILELFKFDWEGVSRPIKEALRYNSAVTLQSLDADGKPVPYDPAKLLLHSLRLTVSNITRDSGELLGSLEIADSYVTLHDRTLKLTSRIKILDMWDNRIDKLELRPSPLDQFAVTLSIEGVEAEGSLMVFEGSWVHSSLKLGAITCDLSEFSRVSQTPDSWLAFSNGVTQVYLQTNPAQFLRLKSQYNFDSELIPQPLAIEYSNPLMKLKPVRKEIEEATGSTAVYIVTGVLGAGTNKLGEQLAKYSDAELLKPSLPQCASFDLEFWASSLQEVTSDKVVVVLPAFCTASNLIPLLRSDMYVACVVVKVSDKRILSGRRKDFFIGFQAQLAAADICILEEFRQSTVQSFIKAINPEITIISARGPISPDQARFIFNQPGSSIAQSPVVVLEDYESLYLRCEIPLRQVKLENRLRTLESLDEGVLSLRMRWEIDMEIIAFKGNLVLLPGESTSIKKASAYQVSGGITGLNVRPSHATEFGLVFIGRKLNRDKLIEVLLNSRAFADKIMVKTRDTLTEEEVRAIESNMPPPDNFFFDGNYYIDSDGTRMIRHPYLEQEIELYIEDENERIGEFNRKLQKETSQLQRLNADARVLPVKV